MADNITISKTDLLYDPLFDKKPDLKMKGKKNTLFKVLFVIIISIFVRIFNENLNITPHKFLIDLRITRAKAMLAEGKSAKDVCYCCGFGNPKTFGETFKRETGLSVSEYTEKLKNG